MFETALCGLNPINQQNTLPNLNMATSYIFICRSFVTYLLISFAIKIDFSLVRIMSTIMFREMSLSDAETLCEKISPDQKKMRSGQTMNQFFQFFRR